MDTLTAKFVDWFNRQFRPVEGWLAVVLMFTAVFCVLGAVLDVGWVAEDEVVIPAVLIGAFLGLVLAKRPLHSGFAWALILVYVVFVTAVYLGHLFPPLPILFQGGEPLRQFWLQNGGFFLDRMGSWLIAVSRGGTSQETIVFAFGLGLAGGLIAAYALWATFRARKPLIGLALMGSLLAVNSYYGNLDIWWMAVFVGVMALVTAVLHFTNLEQKWRQTDVDYSDQLRIDLLLHAGVIAMFLLALSVFLPTIQISKLQSKFQELTAVAETDEALGRAFAGVQQPRKDVKPPSPGRIGGEGILPRSYLLGLAPELAETILMTATVQVQNSDGMWEPAPAELLRGTHWRALSYQEYTGRGWVISEERREPVRAFEPIDQFSRAETIPLRQEIYWQRTDRPVRYTLGLPTQMNQDTTVGWRGLDDLVRVWGEGTLYGGETRLSVAPPDALRQTAVSDVPAPIIVRYTNLPETVPQRVHDLAQEIAGGYSNPYDQARAIERFLRQYPYTLDVPVPPPHIDLVDYFLFDLQRGYCDYYASSMVVMARSLGLPARMAIGFLGQEPDENGVQTVRQINGHSWAEIYFPEYGWIEFEPTGAFASPREYLLAFDTLADQYIPQFDDTLEESLQGLPTIPDRAPQEPFPWGRLFILIGIFLYILYRVWGKWQERRYPSRIEWAYHNFQKEATALGQTDAQSQTPYEFAYATMEELEAFRNGDTPKSINQTAQLQRQVRQLAEVYVDYRYAPEKRKDGVEKAITAWESLKRPLRLLRLKKLFRRGRE